MSNEYNYAKNHYDKGYGADLAYIDDLTNLYNRRHLNKTLPTQIKKVMENDKKLSLFMMDCDDFKNINDLYGHLNGDRVLVEIAGILTKEVGRAGILIRYAGDEFTVMLPEKDLEESLKIAETLLRLTKRHKIRLRDGGEISNITLSIGIAVYPDDADSAERLIDKADQALYSAKRTGKSKVSTVRDLIAEVHDRDLVIKAVPSKVFINREKEIEAIKRGYESANKGSKKFILIEGRQGIGKTRLMLELFGSDDKSPRLILKCSRDNLEQHYGAISIAFNRLLDLVEASDALSIIASMSDINKFALVSAVDKIKNLPIHYSEGTAPSSDKLRMEDVSSAFVNFIKKLKFKILPVLIDDILWIDKGSLEVVRELFENNTTSLLIIGTLTRGMLKAHIAQKLPFTDFMSDKMINEFLETINLEPLTENAVSKLLSVIFSDLLLPSEVVKKILQISWGIPSNIEEVIKYILANKIVYPEKGKWILDEKRLNEIPPSLKDLIQRRIAGLDEESKEILSKAAMLGDDFNVDVLKFFYGKQEGQMLDILDGLSDKGIFQPTISPEEITLKFTNNIIRESIYRAIEKKRLQQLHLKVAEILESYYKFGINKVYGKLRYHLREAGEGDRSLFLADKYDLPSYVKTAFKGEAEPEAEEAPEPEAPLSEKSRKMAPMIVVYLRSAWVNSKLYPHNNVIRKEAIENLNECINRVFENDFILTVRVLGDDIFLNSFLVDRRKINIMIARGLVSLFFDYGIGNITFKKGLKREELEGLFSFLEKKADYIEKEGGFDKLLKVSHITNIKIGKSGYGGISNLAARSRKAANLFRRIALTSSAVGSLFSVEDEGLAINKGMLTSPKKTVNSIYNAISAISKHDDSDDNKSLMILEGLYKAIKEIAEGYDVIQDKEKERLADLFLSLKPFLRTKVIKGSSYYGGDVEDFVTDILSNLDKKSIAHVLHEGWIKTGMPPEELSGFLEVILKSQYPKKLSYEESKRLFKETGMDNKVMSKVLNDFFSKFFYDKVTKKLSESEESGSLDGESIDDLVPLTEALAINQDIDSINKLVEDLLAKMKSTSLSLRISAAVGLGRVLEVLLTMGISDISDTIVSELSKSINRETDINTYIELLKNLEKIIIILLQKQNLSLLVNPLTAIKEELEPPSERPPGFKRYAEQTIDRILSPKNMELLLYSFKQETEKDHFVMINLIAQFGEKALDSAIEILYKKDDARQDPFETYMKKYYIALIIKRIGEGAVSKLRNLLNDERAFVVKNIIDVFGCINDKRYIPYLEQATKHPDKEVRKEALRVIKKLEG